ncbi:ethionine resistance protein [Vanrija albida]|uniref:Ethionine resistance protein n=1 Tax=Vanrija albida TaxID=181172 RepID=A0ABR3QEI9_9TREE
MSNYPHSTLATSLSSSPYALHSNLEALIQRSRQHPHSHSYRHSYPAEYLHRTPAQGGIPEESEQQDGAAPVPRDSVDEDAGMIMFPQDRDEIAAVGGRGRPREDSSDAAPPSSRWRRQHKPAYGAVSEPFIPSASALPADSAVDPSAGAGTSRSRSKGRTPPRRIVRPMTRAHREAAALAGASLGNVPAIDAAAGSLVSTTTVDSLEHGSTSPENVVPGSISMGRGRSSDRRPMSPIITFKPLSNGQGGHHDDDVERGWGAFAPPHAEPLSGDPALELDDSDLDLPTDPTGQEHSSKHALHTELPILLKTTIPIFFTQLAEYSLQLASVVSIGHLGTTQLAASSLANMTASVTGFSIMQGIGTALDTLLPAAWTSSEPTHVGLWTQRTMLVLAIAMFPMLVLWFNMEAILLALNQHPDVAALAEVYLRWLSIGLPGYAGNVALKKYLQAQNVLNVPTIVLFIVAPINLLLNWALVWGPQWCRLGFAGGALATAISFDLTFILLLGYIMFFGSREAFYPFSIKSVCSKLGTVSSLGLAGTVMVSSEWWAWEVCALAASFLGPTTLAAQSVALSTCATLYQFPAALGIASTVRVGNLLGAGRAWEAKWASRASFILATVFALFNSAICIIFRNNWGYMFNSDPEVVAIVASVLPWIGLFQVMDGLSGAVNSILRALALHATGAAVSLTAYYVIGIPIGLWLTFPMKLGLVGIWIGLTIALSISSVVGGMIVWRVDWVRGVERVRNRLGLDTLPPDIKYDDECDETSSISTPRGERQPLLG